MRPGTICAAWSRAMRCCATPISATPILQGLKGDYYDNMDFTGFVFSRVDPGVNFDWGNGSPDPFIGVDNFSIRWTGQVVPLYSQTYTFYTLSDDGVRLWVNGVQLVNNWTVHAPTENSGTIAHERSRVLILLHERDAETIRKLDEIREEYKKRFKQEAVIRESGEVWVAC